MWLLVVSTNIIQRRQHFSISILIGSKDVWLFKTVSRIEATKSRKKRNVALQVKKKFALINYVDIVINEVIVIGCKIW